MLFDTIAAISTPPGEGGIGIIRISGPECVNILKKIFKPKKLKDWQNITSHTLHLGEVIDEKGRVIDEVLVSIMKGPRSFTAEDVVEINCHGGFVALKRTLELTINAGARIAEPGEFSKRAFLNGRIDLTQAESIIDVIRAKTDFGLEMAVGQLKGKFSEKIGEMRQVILGLVAKIEAAIDFPDQEIEEATSIEVEEKVKIISREIKNLLDTADQGRMIREGINTVIVGRTNVGKSSLLNALLKENRAIVTDVPGTTRDTIEEFINIGGFPLKIVDTAGLRETEDVVEKIGVEKSRAMLEKSDLVLAVLDIVSGITDEDLVLLKMLQDKKTIVVINKIDRRKPDQLKSEFEEILQGFPYLYISAKNEIGLTDLEKAIIDILGSGGIRVSDQLMVTNLRHKNLLNNAAKHLNEVIDSLDLGMSIDLISIDLQGAWENLGEITGETAGEDLLDRIFSDFCIGK